MMQRKKAMWFLFIGSILAAGIAIVFAWNKPHATVDNKKGMKITAEELVSAFTKNEQNANATYLKQALEVSGKISEVSKNQDGKDVILLESFDPLSGVQCTMKKEGNYKVGSFITIKGFCNGYTTVVLLSDCIVVE